jgi:opacity protein-like surface antigen
MKKALILIFVLAVAGSSLAASQAAQKVVSFKKLQEFLPKVDLSGFSRTKPGGETSSAMGMSTSQAFVTYKKGDDVSIEVKISDISGVPFAQMGASVIGMTEFETETETGYEKSVKVQGFAGTEKVDNSEDSKSCEIMLFVANRFQVELRGSGTSDAALLHKLLDDMKLGDLSKISQ